jgi:hypothetical protein
MPYDPAFSPDDPWQWWRTRAQPRFLQPNAPANGASGDPAGADGIDDWFVPGQPPKPADSPGIAPAGAGSDGYPDDWIPAVGNLALFMRDLGLVLTIEERLTENGLLMQPKSSIASG